MSLIRYSSNSFYLKDKSFGGIISLTRASAEQRGGDEGEETEGAHVGAGGDDDVDLEDVR